MAEKKVVKVVKVKKSAIAAPKPVTPPKKDFLSIEEELADIDLGTSLGADFSVPETMDISPLPKPAPKEPQKTKLPEVSNIEEDDDDEFEKLLQDFIKSETQDVSVKETPKKEEKQKNEPKPKKPEKTKNQDQEQPTDKKLKSEEKALYTAYTNFINSVNLLAESNNLAPLEISVGADSLIPNYKPSIGRIIAGDTVSGWDIILKVKGSELSGINISSDDEQLLDFAEACDDTTLTMSIISYVETIIEIEGCEITYKEKSMSVRRKRIERQIYEEHQRRIARNKRFIAEIEKKKFPINAERLISNYFKTAQKDPDGAYKVLTTNPAVFAPIEIEKLKPSFFGLIKPTPKDGIKINKRLADFLKSLKA